MKRLFANKMVIAWLGIGMVRKISALLLTMWLLCVNVLPVQAADISSENTVEITCDFADTADIGVYSATIYQVSIDGQYLVAEYCESNHSYIVTGYTTWTTGATRFQLGNSSEQPDKLIISSLPDGTYHFEESKRSDGYTNVKFDVTFSPDGFIVDNTECHYQTLETGKLGKVLIAYRKSFDIPKIGPVFDDGTISAGIIGCTLSLFGLVLASITLKEKKGNQQ